MPTGSSANPGRGKGTFVFSIDTELMWGSFLRVSAEQFTARFGDLRAIIRRLLDLLDTHQIPATWAIVGHLMLPGCTRDADGLAHPEITRPDYEWLDEDWYAADPCTDAAAAPLWYAPELVALIRAAAVEHEIASHSFGHINFGDPGCTSDAARDDLRAWSAAATPHGVTGRSLVFPRNRPGHLQIVAEHGFISYRARPAPPPSNKIARLHAVADEFLGLPAPVLRPHVTPEGLVEIPGSMPYLLPAGRLRRVVPQSTRVAKARRSLTASARRGGVFHMWVHPMDLAASQETMFAGLDRIFGRVARYRQAGRIDALTMREVATRWLAHAP